MRILVVEDDEPVATFIQMGLEEEGHAVDALYDGRVAGVQAGAVDYDAIVLDVMLPVRSGFQVLRDIRARKAALPVLMLTAKDSVEDREVSMRAQTTTWSSRSRSRSCRRGCARSFGAAPSERACSVCWISNSIPSGGRCIATRG